MTSPSLSADGAIPDGFTSRKQWRQVLRGWVLFDPGAQPFHTVVVTFVWVPYFRDTLVGNEVRGQVLVAWMSGIAAVAVAAAAPFTTALAEKGGRRKLWVAAFSLMYVVFCVGMAFEASLIWVMAAFVLAYFAIEMLEVVTNAYLPEITTVENRGQVSNVAWGMGYVGGLVVLVFYLLFLMPVPDTGATVIGLTPLFPSGFGATTGPVSAVWYAVFMIPFFMYVPDTERRERLSSAVKGLFAELRVTFTTAYRDRQLSLFFLSSLVARDALAGLFIFGAGYATAVLDWSLVFVAIYGITLNITGVIGGVVGGYFDRRRGSAFVVRFSLWMFTIVTFVALTTNRTHVMLIPVPDGSILPHATFFVAGMLIGAGAGSLQGSMRGMVGTLTAGKLGADEAYGLYGMLGRATAFMAPIAIGVTTAITDNAQIGAFPIAVLFLASLVIFGRFEREPAG